MEDKAKSGSTLIIVAGALIGVAALLPWASVSAPFIGTVNVAGTDGDGKFTLVVGILVAVFGFLALTNGSRTLLWLAGLGGLIAIFVGGFDAQNVSDRIDDATAGAGGLLQASVGIGLWLTIAGGVLAVVGTLMAISADAPAAAETPPAPPPPAPL